jgi:putative hydrolase of the HAD superfamily
MNLKNVKAIGFDLFNTLITADPKVLGDANSRMVDSLFESGLALEAGCFAKAHHQAALYYIEEVRKNGRETHNRFWISKALQSLGYNLSPEDQRIAGAVEAYFSAFSHHCRLIPHTLETLAVLKKEYRLGLLSNFTHAPAARNLMDQMGLTPLFDTILISGELGYRKPFPQVFQRLCIELGVSGDQVIFIGDDPEADIKGAKDAGLLPVWISYVVDNHLPVVPGILARGTGVPDGNIPRISHWGEMLPLLGK